MGHIIFIIVSTVVSILVAYTLALRMYKIGKYNSRDVELFTIAVAFSVFGVSSFISLFSILLGTMLVLKIIFLILFFMLFMAIAMFLIRDGILNDFNRTKGWFHK